MYICQRVYDYGMKFRDTSRSLSVPRQYTASKPNFPVLFRFSSSDSAAYTATYDFETLTVTAPDNHILHVELNRPENYNAMNKIFWREMLDCFRKIRDDRYCRAVIISGAGNLFSAGLDYSDMQDITSQVAGKGDVARKAKFLFSLIAKYQESFNAVENCQKPVIAAIHGKCSGGGVDLICACDIRYCSEDAFFEIEEVDVGMAADMGTLQRLPKIVGNDSLVREYAFSCAKIDPQEAKTIGLVGRVFPTKEAMMTSALGLAKIIASKSPVAIQGTKVALNFSRDKSVPDGLQFMTYWNMTMLQSEDVLKAAEATINKSDKPPKYSKL
ncbi:delta(3,5)-Delta(2,4)-dienoyl-CoA isomerase, mitochondrial [Caerostris darwini]|uniref:Delta(3,5)-Delta(2,4)-dienoyl-CoA isomerase, mitochondrial n=1 Tax=Caerostris darwini TaxID=1538125 RepID=A0AAV4TF71_9ARAC|nr:delta(3,5)-Delta(2,4)-dienoyl-CoA isomerase, mitochondrial [Caerostris darwini]